MHTRWDKLVENGPTLDYHPNNSKTWLVVKEEHLEDAERVFAQTGVYITCTSKCHLGTVLVIQSFVEEFFMKRSQPGKKSMNVCQPLQDQNPTQHTQHTPTAPLDTGYFLRSIEGIGVLLQPLEDTICQQLLPALTGRGSISDTE